MNRQLTGITLLLIATVTWGAMFPLAKPALAVMDPYWLTLLRYVPAGLVFLLLLAVTEGRNALRLEGRFFLLFALGTLGFAGFNLLAFTGLAHSRPEHAAVIMALMPMLTVLLNWGLRGVRPQGFTLAAITVAFVGVFLVITGGHPQTAFGGGAALWDLLFLAGGCCWVSYTLGAQLFPAWSPLRYTAITGVLGAVALAGITLTMTWSGTLQMPTVATVVSLRWIFLYLIVLGALIAVLSWNSGIRMLGPVNGVLFFNVVPLTTFTYGVLNGEPLRAVEVAGAALVMAGLVANNLYLRRPQREPRATDRAATNATLTPVSAK
jgi:drug/metabolite transporter (DMT)-like permease